MFVSNEPISRANLDCWWNWSGCSLRCSNREAVDAIGEVDTSPAAIVAAAFRLSVLRPFGSYPIELSISAIAFFMLASS